MGILSEVTTKVPQIHILLYLSFEWNEKHYLQGLNNNNKKCVLIKMISGLVV